MAVLPSALYMAGTPAPGADGGRMRREYIDPTVKQSLLKQIQQQTFGGLETLGWVLDTPGAAVRGVLAGEPLSVFSWEPDDRVSGKELLATYGFKPKDPYKAAIAGLATEIVTDPLAWVSGPMRALGIGGKAAKAANILDLAPLAATNKVGYRQAANTLTGRFTDSRLGQLLPNDLAKTAENLAVRPLIGPRLGRSMVNLDDVIKQAPDPQQALKDVLNYLEPRGIKFDDVRQQPLGGMLGFGFMDPKSTWMPKGGEKVLDAMDLAGQRIGWSAPARTMSAFFDQRVGGKTDEYGQMTAMRLFDKMKEGERAGRREAAENAANVMDIPVTPQAAKTLLADRFDSPEGARVLTRIAEGVKTGRDRLLMQQLPQLRNYEAGWDATRQRMIQEAEDLGMQANNLNDRFGVLWSPRSGSEFEFGDWSRRGKQTGNSLFNSGLKERYSRNPNLEVPGGTVELQDISVIPEVREFAKLQGKSQYSDQEIGEFITDFLEQRYGRSPISSFQATNMARSMRHANPDLPSMYPVFAEHPLNAQSRALINHEKATRSVDLVYQLLAESSVNAPSGYTSQMPFATSIPGGGFRSMKNAADEIARAIGLATENSPQGQVAGKQVVDQLKQRIGQRLNRPASSIDLNRIAVPEKVVNTLTQLNDFYTSPQAQEEVANMFNVFTSLTKSFLLAWPSRHTRDAYSNLYQVWIATGNAKDTLWGFRTAMHVLSGDYAKAMPDLQKLPQYSKLATPDEVRRQFQFDAGSEGVLSTLATSDLLSANRSGGLNQLLPGSTPISLTDSVRELVPDGTRTPMQQVGDFFTIRNFTNKFETRNALLNASQKINDWNDSVARLGGYLALLKKGINPAQAAEQMRKALVDYSSLTPFERHYMKNILIWWSYQSRIGKFVVEDILTNPGGRYAQTLRALNTLQDSDENTYIPTALRQQFAVRLPDSLQPYFGGGQANPDLVTYATNFDVPGLMDIGNMVKNDFQGTLAEVANQAHPAFRTLAELVTDRDFFTQRPLSEASGPVDRIYKALTGSERRVNPVLKAVINNVPGLQRPLQLAGGLADDRIKSFPLRALKQGVNAVSGFGVKGVDKSWELQDQLRRLQQRTGPLTKTFTDSYVPEELLPELTAEELLNLAAEQDVQRELREYKQRRRELEAMKK